MTEMIENSINRSKNFLMCLKKLPNRGETCCNSVFSIRKTDEGLIAICTNCSAEHVVKGGS